MNAELALRTTAVAAVQKGVALLNQSNPGWIDEINWDTLILSDMYKCILGQLYGSYPEGCEALGLSTCRCCAGYEENASDYGFTTFDELSFELIEELWRTAAGKI